MLRRPALVGLALALVVPLAACAESTRIPEAEPSSDVAPLFASDDEALAAATAAYEEYLAVAGAILQDGGGNPERLVPLVSDEIFQRELDGFELFQEMGYFAVGESKLEDATLQQHLVGPAGLAEVQIYACVSFESTDVLSASGESVADPGRPLRQSYEAVFSSDSEGLLVLEAESPWTGAGACES